MIIDDLWEARCCRNPTAEVCPECGWCYEHHEAAGCPRAFKACEEGSVVEGREKHDGEKSTPDTHNLAPTMGGGKQ